MRNWIVIKLNHVEHCIQKENIVSMLYNENTECLYLHLINKDKLEIDTFSQVDYNNIKYDLGITI